MAKLSFTFDGEKYVSDIFSGNSNIQLTFPKERIRVLLVESRINETLPWKIVDSHIIEYAMVVSVPAAGEGQQFRMTCIMEPSSADITTIPTPGSKPGPNTVGTNEIVDDSVEMEDLNQSVKDKMMTDGDRVTKEQLDNFEV